MLDKHISRCHVSLDSKLFECYLDPEEKEIHCEFMCQQLSVRSSLPTRIAALVDLKSIIEDEFIGTNYISSFSAGNPFILSA